MLLDKPTPSPIYHPHKTPLNKLVKLTAQNVCSYIFVTYIVVVYEGVLVSCDDDGGDGDDKMNEGDEVHWSTPSNK